MAPIYHPWPAASSLCFPGLNSSLTTIVWSSRAGPVVSGAAWQAWARSQVQTSSPLEPWLAISSLTAYVPAHECWHGEHLRLEKGL